MNRRHNRFVVAAAVVTTAAVLVSPAGAATTAWTSQHLTKAVKSLVGYRNMDSRRDSRQGWKIKAVAHTNFLQTGKLHRLAAFRTSATGRLSGLEAQNVIQAELNGGILDTSKTAELPVGSPGAPHGGWMMFTRDGDCYVLYNGAPGVQGDKGAKGDAGEHGAPGLSAYQVWLAEGNTGTVAAFMQTITGPKGDQGTPGVPGKDGKDGVNGAMGVPGLSAYEEWLAVGNTGSIADFLHSIVGPQARGRQGRQGRHRLGRRRRPVGLPGVALARELRLGRRLRPFADRPAGAEGRQGRHRRDRPTGTADLHPAHDGVRDPEGPVGASGRRRRVQRTRADSGVRARLVATTLTTTRARPGGPSAGWFAETWQDDVTA